MYSRQTGPTNSDHTGPINLISIAVHRGYQLEESISQNNKLPYGLARGGVIFIVNRLRTGGTVKRD
jgi:hypothetical protein